MNGATTAAVAAAALKPSRHRFRTLPMVVTVAIATANAALPPAAPTMTAIAIVVFNTTMNATCG